MRKLALQMIAFCFLAATLFSENGSSLSAHASSAPNQMLAETTLISNHSKATGGIDDVDNPAENASSDHNCSCELSDTSSTFLKCGVALALPQADTMLTGPFAIRCKPDIADQQGVSMFQYPQKRPPRTT